MRQYLLALICIFSFVSVTTAQDELTKQVTFDGFSGDTYNFTTVATDYMPAKTLSFSEINEDILREYDLKSEAFKGETFTIVYKVEVETLETDTGDEEEVTNYKLVSLKK